MTTKGKYEITILRREEIEVDHTEKNIYGGLVVTSKGGNTYTINKKRENLFDYFQPNTKVVIGWASYMNNEYIAEATPADQLVSASTPIETEKPPQEKSTGQPEHSGQETGMWWKELGEMLRAKDIDIAKPEGKLMRSAYYTKMLEVLDIKIKKGE